MHQMDSNLEFQFQLIRRRDSRFFVDQPIAHIRVDSLNPIDTRTSIFLKKPLNPYDDLDYNPFCDENADWDENHRIRFYTPLDDSCFSVDFFNATSAEGEPLIGSGRLPLRDLVLGEQAVMKKLVVTCPSGRQIGEVTVKVAVRRVENPLPPERTVPVVYEEPALPDMRRMVPVVYEEPALPDMR